MLVDANVEAPLLKKVSRNKSRKVMAVLLKSQSNVATITVNLMLKIKARLWVLYRAFRAKQHLDYPI